MLGVTRKNFFGLYQSARVPYVIAITTYKEAVRLPLFYILVFFFSAVIFLSKEFTFFCFDHQLPIIKEVAIATIGIAGILLSVLLAGTTITADVERKTSMTILSKPISKGQFIAGKYFGVLLTVVSAVFFLSLTTIMTLWLAEGKPNVESLSEHGLHLKNISQATSEDVNLLYENYIYEYLKTTVVGVLKGASLCAFQIFLMSALSVVLSLFFSLTVNAGICLLVFLIGHFSVYIYLTAKQGGAVVSALGTVFFTLFPNLDYFIGPGHMSDPYFIPLEYISFAFLYCLVYTAVILYTGTLIYNRTELQ